MTDFICDYCGRFTREGCICNEACSSKQINVSDQGEEEMTIEEKARKLLEGELVTTIELSRELAWELIKIQRKIHDLDLFMADHDVPSIHRKEIKDYFNAV